MPLKKNFSPGGCKLIGLLEDVQEYENEKNQSKIDETQC